MISTISKQELVVYVSRQLNNMLCDGREVEPSSISEYMNEAYSRVEFCFSKVNNKYFFNDGHSRFNHLHGDQYAMFLYFLSNTIYKRNGSIELCSKLFLLNKLLHGVDVFYEIMLPEIFLMVHPLGTVLGRAQYSDYLLIYQRVGVGANNGIYPQLGKHLSLHPGSSILGNCQIANNCQIGSGALVIDKDLGENTLYVGNPKQYKTYIKKQISEFWIL